MRFVILMSILFGALIALALTLRGLEHWRHDPPSVRAGSPLARELLDTPIQGNPAHMFYVVDALSALGLQTESEAFADHISRAIMSKVLGDTFEPAPTVGAAVQSEAYNRTSLRSLRERVLMASLGVSFPPGYAIAKTPDAKSPFLVSAFATNKLPAPVGQFKINFAIQNLAAALGRTKVDAQINCNGGSYVTSFASGERSHVDCHVYFPDRTITAAEFSEVLEKVRAGVLSLSVSVVQIAIGVDAPEIAQLLVSAAQSKFVTHGAGKGYAMVSGAPCEQRADCLPVFKRKLSEYAPLLVYALVINVGMILGVLVRALIGALPQSGSLRTLLSVTVLVLAIGVVPLAASQGGGGWGPLVLAIYAVILVFGFFAGFALQALLSKKRSA